MGHKSEPPNQSCTSEIMNSRLCWPCRGGGLAAPSPASRWTRNNRQRRKEELVKHDLRELVFNEVNNKMLQWVYVRLAGSELAEPSVCVSVTQTSNMQRIYMQSNERFEVFTTVLAPQARYRCKADVEKMVVIHSYKPHWPDELELSRGDVILVLTIHEEERWFGWLQNGQRGYFPASCVMELSQCPQENTSARDLRRPVSLRSRNYVSGFHPRCGSGHGLQTPGRSSRGGGGTGLEAGQGEREGPFLEKRLPVSPPLALPAQTHSSPGLLHRILSKHRKKTQRKGATDGAGATNGAFEDD